MIRVSDSAIEIAQLVVDHIFEVNSMEVVGKSSSEVNSKSSVEEIQHRINKGGRNGKKPEVDDSLNK